MVYVCGGGGEKENEMIVFFFAQPTRNFARERGLMDPSWLAWHSGMETWQEIKTLPILVCYLTGSFFSLSSFSFFIFWCFTLCFKALRLWVQVPLFFLFFPFCLSFLVPIAILGSSQKKAW